MLAKRIRHTLSLCLALCCVFIVFVIVVVRVCCERTFVLALLFNFEIRNNVLHICILSICKFQQFQFSLASLAACVIND